MISLNQTTYLKLAVACLVLMTASSAHAFRCGNDIIAKDSLRYEVISACGEPSQKDFKTVEVTRYVSVSSLAKRGLPDNYVLVGDRIAITEDQIIEEWIYDFGPNKLVRKLTFQDGKISHIESLGYGKLQN